MFLISIKFKASFGDETKTVEVSTPNGGGSVYHISVDSFYWGVISKMLGGWRVQFQLPRDDFNMGDLQELLDLVIPLDEQERARKEK